MLLEQLGVTFEVFEPDVDERVDGRHSPASYVKIVAHRKILTYIERIASATEQEGAPWALAADTVVALGRRIIGKPADRGQAEATLRMLSGRTHRVITGLALYNPDRESVALQTATTRVRFAGLTDEEIEWYLSSGEWQDVAGAYRIQERGSVLVRSLSGSYSNVVGLPIETFYGMVQAQGYHLFPQGDK